MKWLRIICASIVLIGICWMGWWFIVRALVTSGSTDRPDIEIQIGSGWDAAKVATLLQERGIIDSAFGYRVYALFSKAAQHPQSGTYFFFAPENYREIARRLSVVSARPEATIKIIEGWTLSDIGDVLAAQGVSSSTYMEQVGNSERSVPFSLLWRETFPFLAQLPVDATLEGYLFPNTYRVWADELPQSLVRKQLQEFEQRVRPIAAKARSEGKDLREIVILASIVEKEVSRLEDRRIVAGIFLNRLNAGMPLQSDATINYITKSGRDRSTAKDLAIDSPFNTYRNKGLPPSPICNPGLDALEAASSPTPSNYVYFLTDARGVVYYAKTFEEHQRNRVKAFGR